MLDTYTDKEKEELSKQMTSRDWLIFFGIILFIGLMYGKSIFETAGIFIGVYLLGGLLFGTILLTTLLKK